MPQLPRPMCLHVTVVPALCNWRKPMHSSKDPVKLKKTLIFYIILNTHYRPLNLWVGMEVGWEGSRCGGWARKEWPIAEPLWSFSNYKYLFLGFPGGTSGKDPICQCRRHKRCGFDPWVRKIPGGRHSNSLQYSCLENPMDKRAWQTTVHKVAKSQIWLKQLSMHAHTYLFFPQMCPPPLLWQKPLLHGEVANDVTLSHRPKNWLKTTALSNGVNRVLTRTYKGDGQHCGFILGYTAGTFSI